MRMAKAFALVVLVGVTGCSQLTAPDGFLAVRRGVSELKAVSADEALYWVRQFSDPEQAGFPFWDEVLRNEFIEQRGYTLVEERSIDVLGHPGVELLFEVTVAGVARNYILGMSVAPGMFSDEIRVIEFVSDKARFPEHVAAVRDVMARQ